MQPSDAPSTPLVATTAPQAAARSTPVDHQSGVTQKRVDQIFARLRAERARLR